MPVKDVDFDIVFVGAGFTALSVASAMRHKDSTLTFAFVAKESQAGGVWTSAAEGVRLHQRTHAYALPSCTYDDPRCQTDGLHTASGAEVRGYTCKVLNEVNGTLIAGKVIDVELKGEDLRSVLYVAPDDEEGSQIHPQRLTCRRVVQATGFDFYSGEPRTLGMPREVHSSQLQAVSDSLRGKTCLVVGSGKSALDAVRLLIAQGNTVRCIYRTPTAFITMRFTAWYAKLLQLFNPSYYITYFLNESLCGAAAPGTYDTSWTYDWSEEETVRQTLKFLVVGNGTLQSTMHATRGGICRRSEFLLMNWLLHAHGVQGDVTKMRISELSGCKVACSAFPGVVFDHVVACSGYKGTTTMLPHTISALTPILDLHLISGWIMGHVIHSVMDDKQATASWNGLALHKAKHPWIGHYAHTRAWCAKHRAVVVEEAWQYMRTSLSATSCSRSAPTWAHRVAMVIDKSLAGVCDMACELHIKLVWACAPAWASKLLLGVFGGLLARQ